MYQSLCRDSLVYELLIFIAIIIFNRLFDIPKKKEKLWWKELRLILQGKSLNYWALSLSKRSNWPLVSKLMKRNFVSRIERAQMNPNPRLDACEFDETASVTMVTGVVPATAPSMPKSERESIL